ncbi:MAG TPA: Calx-beta domain-containing protein [Pyrinomonadaceae bacterium]
MKKNGNLLKYFLLAALIQSSFAPSLLMARTTTTPKRRVATTTATTTRQDTQGEGQLQGVQKSAVSVAVVNAADLARQEALSPASASVDEPREFVPPPNPMPRELPVPEGATVTRDTSSSADAVSSVPAEQQEASAPSPAPAASFRAFGYTGHYPPDTHGAVGINHLVTVLNGRFGVQDRNGNVVLSMSQAAFWNGINGGAPPDVFDPKVLYDPYAQRFIMTSCATRRSAASSVLIGVSMTGDPTGNWKLYRVDADAADLSWADFPSIGFNKNWIVVHMNMFDNDPDVAPAVPFRSQLWVFDKPSMYAGFNNPYTEIQVPNVGGTMVPAITLDPNLETLYLLQNWNGNSGGSGYLRFYSITGLPSVPVLNFATSTSVHLLSTPNPWASNPPTVNNSSDFAPQLGTTQKIQANDSRMHSVVYRNGRLWATQTVFLPAGSSSTRSAVQWWEINPSIENVIQRGRIDDPSGNTFYSFPSITVNKNNDVLIGYSRFRASEYASAAYSYRAAGDPPNTTRDDALLKAGEDVYARVSEDRNRWGDYSATVVDPVDDTTMWTIQEYAAPRDTFAAPTSAGRWATWWGRINSTTTPPPPALPSIKFDASLPVSVSETAGSVQLTVMRSGDVSGASTVDYATTNGTASDRSDYSAALGTLRFAAGETTKTVNIFLANDVFDETVETFNVALSNVAGATLDAQNNVLVRIISEDAGNGANPVKAATFNAQFFVRQHYIDFFNREPDAGGLSFWMNQATNCGNPDLQVCRDNVSAAFFVSTEFQQTGYFVYKMYQAAYGARIRETDNPRVVPLTLREFLPDTQQIGRGIIVNQGNWQQQLEANTQAYVNEFVTRPLFLLNYPTGTSALDFVNRLNANTDNSLTPAERDSLVNRINAGLPRAQALREVAENALFTSRQYNRAFVLMQYFGYMRRNPYDAPELNLDFGGYNFWLTKLNNHGGNYITSQMVRAFITSGEYEQRFGQ